jgi:hypothetical protein
MGAEVHVSAVDSTLPVACVARVNSLYQRQPEGQSIQVQQEVRCGLADIATNSLLCAGCRAEKSRDQATWCPALICG